MYLEVWKHTHTCIHQNTGARTLVTALVIIAPNWKQPVSTDIGMGDCVAAGQPVAHSEAQGSSENPTVCNSISESRGHNAEKNTDMTLNKVS